jgi:NADH dehydrogenase FAD-containing subunit
MKKRRLVVVGGGFAGVTLVKNLSKEFEITLIDKKPYFEFTPGLSGVLVVKDKDSSIRFDYEKNLSKINFIVGEADSFDNKKILLMDGKKIFFDFLVLSTGSKYSTPVKDCDKNMPLRIEHLDLYRKKISESNIISVIGGGVVGVEIAGKLASTYKNKQINLIQSQDHLIPRNNRRSQSIAENTLKKLGVKIHFKERFMGVKDNLILTKKNKIKSDMNIFAIGIKPNSNYVSNKYVDKGGYIVVDEYFRLNGKKNVFSIGDLTNIKEEKTAQVAIAHAKLLSNNLGKNLKINSIKKYKSKKNSMIISLGKNAIFENGRFSYFGRLPYILKRIIQKRFMYSFR